MGRLRKEKKVQRLEIIGFIDSPRWKTKLKCVCDGTKDFKNCKFCNYQNCEDTVPRTPFTVIGADNKEQTVTKITIDRGTDDEIRGYIF